MHLTRWVDAGWHNSILWACPLIDRKCSQARLDLPALSPPENGGSRWPGILLIPLSRLSWGWEQEVDNHGESPDDTQFCMYGFGNIQAQIECARFVFDFSLIMWVTSARLSSLSGSDGVSADWLHSTDPNAQVLMSDPIAIWFFYVTLENVAQHLILL